MDKKGIENNIYPATEDGEIWDHLKWVFQSGEDIKVDTYAGSVTLQLKKLGMLKILSGWIVAGDPGYCEDLDQPPFAHQVVPGEYPVWVNVATRIESNDQRVAFGILKLGDDLPIRWEIATLRDKELIDGKHPEEHGYSVDSGLGCFMDLDIVPLMVNDLLEQFDDELSKTYVPTWQWANFQLDKKKGLNFIAFSSGDGDGCYPSFWGINPSGQRVTLVTDFYIVMSG